MRLFVAVGSVSVLLSLFLMGARTVGALSFSEPLQGMTRGVEFEMMYSIWRYVQGLPVYVDPDRIPFIASYYNWLFYAVYGEVARLVLGALSLGDAWLPTITRLTTVAGALAGTWATYRTMSVLLEIRETGLRAVTFLLGACMFLGPLLGFWAIATGPDVWPMVFAVAAVYVMGRHYPRHRIRALLAVCVLAYAAWGFKQNFLYIPGTIGLFLLLRRDWTGTALLTTVLVLAAALTVWAGGSDYLGSILFRGAKTVLSWAVFAHNAFNFGAKFLPVLLTAAGCLILVAGSRRAREALVEPLRGRPVLMIPYIGVGIGALEGMPSSAIVNAAENHYFTMALFLTLSTIQAVVHLNRRYGRRKLISAAGSLGWGGNMAAVAVVLLGIQGLISVRPYHDLMMERRACLSDLRAPFYVSDPYMALPWLTEAGEPFVVHNGYWLDVADGKPKERNGLFGLIAGGYFGTLALPENLEGSRFADYDLRRYQPRPGSCGGLVIYDRSEDGDASG